MKRVDAAAGTKVVLGLAHVELVQGQYVRALQYLHIAQVGRNSHRATHAAVGAVASTGTAQAVCELHLKPNCTAMTGRLVHGPTLSGDFAHTQTSSLEMAVVAILRAQAPAATTPSTS